MKLLVIGNAGSGKSSLSKLIAKHYHVEWFSLDNIVWKEYWQQTSRVEQTAKISKLISKKSWVIDGVDYNVLRAADKVIFLDIPRRVCFYRVAKRNLKYLFKSRPELPAHCPEILIIPTLFKIIMRFPKRVKPKILEEMNRRDPSQFVHVKNNTQLRIYLKQI